MDHAFHSGIYVPDGLYAAFLLGLRLLDLFETGDSRVGGSRRGLVRSLCRRKAPEQTPTSNRTMQPIKVGSSPARELPPEEFPS